MQMDYLKIAINDIQYLKGAKGCISIYANTNNLCTQTQQIVEKLFKHVLCLNNVDGKFDKELRTHSLSKLYESLLGLVGEDKDTLDYRLLNKLSDTYINGRYPGDSYTSYTEEDFNKFYSLLEDILSWLKDGVLDEGSIQYLTESSLITSDNKEYQNCKTSKESGLNKIVDVTGLVNEGKFDSLKNLL